MKRTKVANLEDAIAAHVAPGMHLNFASTPSRSNAAVREVARRFRGTRPDFVLSATGFHSLAHVLGALRLGRKYVACFFGDNYPIPRPNELYSQLRAEGAELEPWSLWAYVTALRAGALGHAFGITRSLRGTTMGDDLRRSGAFVEIPDPDGHGTVGLVRAMRPDVTFVHGLLGDEAGNVLFSPPYGEGLWGAFGATKGVIATVERIVDPAELARFRGAVTLPAHRVLAVAAAPLGAHPQPLFADPQFGVPGYPDDFDHYELWRSMAQDPAALAGFERAVLEAADGATGYREFVGSSRLEVLPTSTRSLVATRGTSVPPPAPSSPPPPLSVRDPRRASYPDGLARANEIHVVLAARTIMERVRAGGYAAILAGIGHSFLAARLAKLWLGEEGVDVKVMVETGMFDLECGASANDFLLAHENIAQARRLSSVEDVLGTLTCGADNRCLGVIGAAQVDPRGSVNSTVVRGKFLVGSGGANDIASSAAEVVVLARCSASRLVRRLDYVTSPGERVLNIVTDLCSFTRRSADEGWALVNVYPAHGGYPVDYALAAIRGECPWDYVTAEEPEYAPVLSTAEMLSVHRLDPRGIHWRRER